MSTPQQERFADSFILFGSWPARKWLSEIGVERNWEAVPRLSESPEAGARFTQSPFYRSGRSVRIGSWKAYEVYNPDFAGFCRQSIFKYW
jgi:hypothetical protein